MLFPAQITSAACVLVLLAPFAASQSAVTYEAAPVPRVVEVQPAQAQQGWLGVSVEVGEGSGGLVLTDVAKGSAAERAGLRGGDRIRAFEGRPITTYEELSAAVRGRPQGTRVRVSIERAVEVPLKAWDEDPNRVLLGVYLDDVRIGSTMPGYGAEQAGLLAGDRIVAVAGEPVHSKEEATAAVSARKPGEKLSISIERDVEVRLGARPGPVPVPVDPLVREVPLNRLAPPIARPAPRALDASAGIDELRAELRELAAALRSLRDEVDVLRDEVDRLRRDR